MKAAEKKAAEMVRRLANEKFSLSDLNVSLSYIGESQGEKKKESEQLNRFLQEVEKRRGAIC